MTSQLKNFFRKASLRSNKSTSTTSSNKSTNQTPSPTSNSCPKSTMSSTVLITGSKSGIGKALLASYAARPNTIAISAIRDSPDSAVAKELKSLPVGKGSKVIVVKYDAASPSAASEAVSALKSEHSITHLDVVVANAGILKHFGPAIEASPETLLEHLQINTLAPIFLYQATHALLSASTTPKFFIISSTLGSIGSMSQLPLPMLAYGMSKAAVNYAAVKFHSEDSKIIVVPVQPGWVQVRDLSSHLYN